MAKKVPEQKGKIIANPPTMLQMPYKAKVVQKVKEDKMRRSGQELVKKKPKK